MWPWIQDPDPSEVLIAKAEALAALPHPTASVGPPIDEIDPRTAPLVAQAICAQEIPLAPGCNSAAYVGWLGEDMGQITTVSAARSVLHANAFRDWLWTGTHKQLDPAQKRAFALVVGRRTGPGRRLPLTEILDAVQHDRTTEQHRSLAARNFPDLDGRPGLAPTPDLWAARLEEGRRSGRVSRTGEIDWTSRGL